MSPESKMFDAMHDAAAVKFSNSPERSLEEKVSCPKCNHSFHSHSPDGCVELPCPCLLSQDAVRVALSPKQGELPPRPVKETLVTGLRNARDGGFEAAVDFEKDADGGFYDAAEADAHFDALESLLRASNAEVGRLREELKSANEYHEGYVAERKSTLEEVFAAGREKGREECTTMVEEMIPQFRVMASAALANSDSEALAMMEASESTLQAVKDSILALPKVGA